MTIEEKNYKEEHEELVLESMGSKDRQEYQELVDLFGDDIMKARKKLESNFAINATRRNSGSTTKLKLDETIDQTPTKIKESLTKMPTGIQVDEKKLTKKKKKSKRKETQNIKQEQETQDKV